MTHGSRTLARTGLAAAIALGGCADHVPPTLHAREAPPARLDERSFLKVHMTSGELYLLDSWQVDATRSRVDGTGTLYSPAREPGPVGRQSVRVEDVALFELDRPEDISSA